MTATSINNLVLSVSVIHFINDAFNMEPARVFTEICVSVTIPPAVGKGGGIDWKEPDVQKPICFIAQQRLQHACGQIQVSFVLKSIDLRRTISIST